MQMITRNGRFIRCLLIGYNGTGNTGSDIRLLTAIDDVRAAFGAGTRITVASMDRDRTAAMLPADETIEVIQISFAPHRFIPTMWRLAWMHDVTILIEGSTFKQNWSPWLLHSFLWAAKHSLWCGNHVVAYAVDVGKLSPFNSFFTRWIANQMSLLITRTEVARERLIALGVSQPIIANTDTAFQHRSDCLWPSTGRRTVGIAPIEFFHRPVRLSPFARAEDRYRWPFSFTWNTERREKSQAMVENFTKLTQHALRSHDFDVKLIAMEDVDIPVCRRILDSLGPEANGKVSLVTSRETGPADVVATLRGLDALVTSRYNACVLSMENAVPQIAINHDERLESLYTEMEIHQDYLLHYRDPDLLHNAIAAFDSMIRNRLSLSRKILEMLESRYLPLCLKNRSDLHAWARSVFDPAGTKTLQATKPKNEDRLSVR